MRCPTLSELPPPPPGKTGWPWTEESPQLPDTMPDGSPWPRVSIVTPSYNQAQFIEETIRSVLLQGYPDLEYIIIDGGSTDGSVEIIRKYEPWLAYWVSEKDGGQSDAINKGWKRSSGEILVWLNSDDIYEPGALGAAAGALTHHPEVAVLTSDIRVVDSEGHTLRLCPAGSFDCVVQLFTDTLLQPGMFMRRDALEAVGWLDPGLHYVMDWELWHRIWLGGYGFQCLPGIPLARYRYWSDAKSVNRPIGFALERLQVLDRLYDRPDLPPAMGAARAEAYYYAHMGVGLQYHLLGQVQAAQAHVEKALEWSHHIRGKLPDWSFLAPSLVGEPQFENCAQRFADLVEAVAQDREPAWPVNDLDSNLIAAVYVVRAWEGYQQGDLEKVRENLWQVCRWRPSALLERGLLSIGLESVVGPGLMKYLRAVSHTFRRRGRHNPDSHR